MRVGKPCHEAVHDAVRREEAYCRFCEMQLPDWTSAYAAMPRGEPLMTISHNGRIFLITGKPPINIEICSNLLQWCGHIADEWCGHH